MGKLASTQFNPEGPEDQAGVNILHTSSEDRNTAQIHNLIAIRTEASRFLSSREEIGVTNSFDKGAVEDARDVYTAAGHQMRNLLDDAERWTLRLNKAEAHTINLLEAKQNEVAARADYTGRPSVAYRPRVLQMPIKPDNQLAWVVWLGNDLGEPQMNGIFGVGQTVELAMRDFDEKFKAPILRAVPAVEKPIVPSEISDAAPEPKQRKKK